MNRPLRKLFTGSLFFLSAFALTGLTGCVKTNYVNVEPPGYQSGFNDDFQTDNSGWGFDDNFNDAHVSVYGGELKYTYYPNSPGINQTTVHTGMYTNADWLIQTRLSSNNAMALSFGGGGGEFGYTFFIDEDGYFAVYDEGNSSDASVPLIDWKASSAIRSGWNDLEIEQTGNTWTGYINGSEVFRMAARTMFGDRVGYSVVHNTTGYAEYLTVKW